MSKARIEYRIVKQLKAGDDVDEEFQKTVEKLINEDDYLLQGGLMCQALQRTVPGGLDQKCAGQDSAKR